MAALVSITPYHRSRRDIVHDLMFRTSRVHTHLDWQETGEWLETQDAPIRLAWRGSTLVGLMAASKPLNQTCWLRMIILDEAMNPSELLCALWTDLRPELMRLDVHQAALLGVREWILPFLPALGFTYLEDIVTLRRGAQSRVMPPQPVSPASIRLAEAADIETMSALDQAAFVPPWQLTSADLRHAYRVAASCTVAVLDSAVVGYQLSTLYFDGAHLARLGVSPHLQGLGIGAALLHDLLLRFNRRGVNGMTVNTQASNVRSQRLYARYGFNRNGYDLPVWTSEV
jgi:ribosomal protein S18 acetylase RimI-like enzyme